MPLFDLGETVEGTISQARSGSLSPFSSRPGLGETRVGTISAVRSGTLSPFSSRPGLGDTVLGTISGRPDTASLTLTPTIPDPIYKMMGLGDASDAAPSSIFSRPILWVGVAVVAYLAFLRKKG